MTRWSLFLQTLSLLHHFLGLYSPCWPLRGAHGPGRPLRAGRRGDGGGQDRRPAAAPSGRRPAEVPAGGAALRRADRPDGEGRAARAPAAGEDRTRPHSADGQESPARIAAAAQEDAPEQGAPQRTDALVRQAQRQGGAGNPTGAFSPSRLWPSWRRRS